MGLLAIDPGRKGLGWAYLASNLPGSRLLAVGVVPQPAAAADYVPPALAAVASNAIQEIRAGIVSAGLDWRGVNACVVERMRLYPPKPRPRGAKRSKNPVGELVAKANDLLDLQAIGATVAAAFCPYVVWRYPAEWKGSTTAEQIDARMREGLLHVSVLELAMIDTIRPAGLRHNALEAFAMGGVELGRFRLH